MTGREYSNTAGFAYRDTMCKRQKWAVAVLKFFWYEKLGGKSKDKVNKSVKKTASFIRMCFTLKILVSLMCKLLAHEIAHVLGIKHDGDSNSCNGKTENKRLMTPVVSQEANTWSSCTRRAALKMVKSGADFCLLD